jgi:ferric-dicitrate binding protein FerR (iron transport regulator)
MNARQDDHFDATLRARHQASLERLSPRVQAQLAQRRHAALRGVPARRTHGFRYAAGFAALCALAIGLQVGIMPAPTTPATSPATGLGSATAADATLLDEDPEFYAWLASSDAQLVAMESP